MNNEEQSALNVVMEYLDSYAKQDVDGCMSSIAASAPVLVYGTNNDEVFKTTTELRAAFERDFTSISNIQWGNQRSLHVVASETIANVLIELPLSFQAKDEDVETLFRYSLALTKENDQWKICSGMACIPCAAE